MNVEDTSFYFSLSLNATVLLYLFLRILLSILKIS